MYQVIIVIHILLGLGIIGLILMQQGKGADAGAGFGGGASGSVFGAQGAASFLSRTTAILATLFFITSLGLAWLNGNKSGAAADFMNTTAVEKQVPDIGLPDVDAGKAKESIPAALPENNPGAVVPPAVQQAIPAAPAAPVDAKPVAIEQAVPAKAADAPIIEEKESELTPEKPKSTPAKKK